MKKRCKKYAFFLLSVLLSVQVFGQSHTYEKKTVVIDTAEQKGKFSGQVRYFFMATDNKHPLTDYTAHALDVQTRYETRNWRHFNLAAGGSAVYNLASSDLLKNDSLAKRPSRYEAGLFDLRNPNKKSIYRLEELYLQYSMPKGWVRLGAQPVNTPFINPQDGRMRPTFACGIYSKFNFPSTQLEGGWIGGLLPRSISHWYSVATSIGLYPQGVNTDGTAANYAGHLSSKGIVLAGLSQTVLPGIKVKLWEQFTENIFNTSWVQIDVEKSLNEKTKFLTSFQYVNQVRINNGGSSKAAESYYNPAGPVHVIGGMTGLKAERWEVSLNYTRIFKGGRYLMPREWGREPFFTFMPRERNEGFGEVQAFVIKTAYDFPKAGLKTSLQAGHFQLPDVKNVTLNKYGLPSYNQVNVELRYTPPFARKFDLQFLYVYKEATGNTYQNPVFVFNKVAMANYNLVLNYTW